MFHEVLFPPDISFGSSGGPKFKTTIFVTDAGYEQRNIDWSRARHEWDVAHSMRDQFGEADLVSIETLGAFFLARAGRAHGFRFKDWNDYLIDNQVIGTGDGSKTVFQIIKTYRSYQPESGVDLTYTRTLVKIGWGTLENVSVGGVVLEEGEDFTVDYNTGLITFEVAPEIDAEVKIERGEFHVPVRFDTDHCSVEIEDWNTASWPSIPIIEDRNNY
jgi:uncharacterized protein (TIGR02217 family)